MIFKSENQVSKTSISNLKLANSFSLTLQVSMSKSYDVRRSFLEKIDGVFNLIVTEVPCQTDSQKSNFVRD